MTFDLAALDAPPPRDGSRYVIGMLRELRARGFVPGAFYAGIESTVPLSAGMSSSAALEISCGLAIAAAFGVELDMQEWARAGQGVENNYLGLKTGLLDQFSSLFGRSNSMIMSDFRSVEVTDTLLMPEGYVFVVVNSMKKHHLVDSDYNVRRNDCENAAIKLAAAFPGVSTLRDVTPDMLAEARSLLSWREFRRAQHVVGECARVKAAAELLGEGDVRSFGRLLFESHDSSRMNFENSTSELDTLIDLARTTPGCLGARLSGGGFGGITIHLVKSTDAEEYAKRVQAGYKVRTGIEAEYIICAIGDGASSCKL
jgi:galactokinase